jgi:hypothetical protein
MPYLRRVGLDPSLLVLLGGAALLVPACTTLLGTFELGSTGGSSSSGVSTTGSSSSTGGGDSSSTGSGGASSSSSTTGGSGGDMTTGAGGGDPGSGTPQSAAVAVPFGASDFAHPSSVSARQGIIAVGGTFSGQFHVANLDTVCSPAKSCGFVTRFDISTNPGPHLPQSFAIAGTIAGDVAIVRSVAVDSKGYTFVAGSYSGSLSINGSSSLPIFNDGGIQHAFLTKINDMGSPQWAVVAKTAGPSSIASVAVAPDDAPIVAGDFTGSFALSNCGAHSVPGAQTSSFVTKLGTGSGACVWSTGLFGTDVTIKSVASDAGGNALVTGSHVAATAFLGGVMLPKSASPGGDLFVAKLASASPGTPLWLRDTKVTMGAAGASVAPVQDANGQFGVMVTGKLDGTAFPGTACAVAAPAGASSSSLVARLEGVKGDCVWARSFAGDSAAVAVDGKGDLTLTGTFTGQTQLDATHVLDSGVGPAVFVGKLGSIVGTHRWSRAFVVQNAGDSLAAKSVSGDPGSGHWFVIGELDGIADFGLVPPLGTVKGGFLVHLGN